jgi:hypothetical protein
MPAQTSYPATLTPGQVVLCKDASSPSGTYTFAISATPLDGGDQVAASATLTPGSCVIVFNRTGTVATVVNVTITEQIPLDATYRINHIDKVDFDGHTSAAGPSVTLKLNEYHGASANFVNETVPTTLPVSAPYPGVADANKASICKDASSPAGTYTYTVSATGLLSGDLIASSASVQPGQCALVYLRTTTSPAFTSVTMTEVIAQGASYTLDHVAVNDPDGPRNLAGPGVTLKVSSFHGAVATYFNVDTAAFVPPLVPLGAAGSFGILAATTVTCVTGGTVNGDVGNSPGTGLTGFPPCTTSGSFHIADGVAAQAQLDLTAAYNALAALPCPGGNVLSADLGGTTKAAGVYCSGTSIALTGTLTLDGGGDPNATFVFQAGSTFVTAGNIVLINGAQARNVYFQVGSSATLGTGSVIQGNILAQASITINDNVTLNGRALARTGAVTLGTGDTINLP